MVKIKNKEKKNINQPNYKAPVVSDTSKLSLDLKNIKKDTFYQNSEVFPPRGSFMNIPEDVLSGSKSDLLDNKKEDKKVKNDLDLYK